MASRANSGAAAEKRPELKAPHRSRTRAAHAADAAEDAGVGGVEGVGGAAEDVKGTTFGRTGRTLVIPLCRTERRKGTTVGARKASMTSGRQYQSCLQALLF